MHAFFEFFIERLVWLWKPIFSLYKLISNLTEQEENKK